MIKLSLILLMAGCFLPQSSADSHAFEAHFDAQIPNLTSETGQPVNSHGYVYLFSDIDGNGLINVLFSNGDRTKSLRFSAQISFYDQFGTPVHEEIIHSQMQKANSNSAFERKVTNTINFGGFSTVAVEFYTTESNFGYTGNERPATRVKAQKLWQYPE